MESKFNLVAQKRVANPVMAVHTTTSNSVSASPVRTRTRSIYKSTQRTHEHIVSKSIKPRSYTAQRAMCFNSPISSRNTSSQADSFDLVDSDHLNNLQPSSELQAKSAVTAMKPPQPAQTSQTSHHTSHHTSSLERSQDPSCVEQSPCCLEQWDYHFWRSIRCSTSPADYGADQVGTLFGSDRADGWGLGCLESILHTGMPPLGGITKPMLYFGTWRAVFAWHTEDCELNSVNFLHFGAPKIWYAVPPKHASKLEAMARVYYAEEARHCSEFLRHKNILLSPTQLMRAGVPVVCGIQTPGEFMITFPRAYHAGFNCGWNCAESVNFATPRWIPYARKTSWCTCLPYTLKVDVDTFVRTVREKTPGRLPALPQIDDMVFVKWQDAGEFCVRVVQLEATALGVRATNYGRKFSGVWEFDPLKDEWRWPSIADRVPEIGDTLYITWQDSAREYLVLVSAREGGGLVVSGVDSDTSETYAFDPLHDDWRWPAQSM